MQLYPANKADGPSSLLFARVSTGRNISDFPSRFVIRESSIPPGILLNFERSFSDLCRVLE